MTRPGLSVVRLVLVAGLLALPASVATNTGFPVADGAEPSSQAGLSPTSLVPTVGSSVSGQIGTMAGRRDHQRSHQRSWAHIVFAAVPAAFGSQCAIPIPLASDARIVLTYPTTFSRAPPRPAFA